jgi:hypothetical protein
MDDIANLGWRIFSRFVGPTEEVGGTATPVVADTHRLPAPAE